MHSPASSGTEQQLLRDNDSTAAARMEMLLLAGVLVHMEKPAGTQPRSRRIASLRHAAPCIDAASVMSLLLAKKTMHQSRCC